VISGVGTCLTRDPERAINQKPIEERWEKAGELLRWIEEEKRKEERFVLYVKGEAGSIASITLPTFPQRKGGEKEGHPALLTLYNEELNDADIALRTSAERAHNWQSFKKLYYGPRDERRSPSQDDLALANFLVFHQIIRQDERDDVQIGRLFMHSSLGHCLLQSNIKSRSYLWDTIDKANDQRPATPIRLCGGAR